MDTEVNFHDIVTLQDDILSWVWGKVGRAVIQAQTSRKSHPSLQAVAWFQSMVTGQGSHAIFDPFGDICQGLSRLNVLSCPLANLAMNFCSMAIVVEVFIIHVVEVADFFTRRPGCILIIVFRNLTGRINAGWEES
jgi:hypothetical protein